MSLPRLGGVNCGNLNMKKYKAIFFDAGGTLLTVYPSVGQIYSEIALKYGCKASPEDIEKLFNEKRGKKDKRSALVLTTNRETEKKMWFDTVYGIFSQLGTFGGRFNEFFEELYEAFADTKFWRLYPEVNLLLKELKAKNYTLGIVSNWDARLYSLCSQLGIKEYFDFILVSAEVGSSKPSRIIFEKALKQAKVNKNEAVHVGDHIIEDIEGALNFGIDAILIDRSGKNSYNNIKSISCLSELIRIL